MRKMKHFIIYFIILVVANCQDSTVVNPEGCGLRLNDMPGKIVGGSPAQVGDWGWQVAINYNNRHSCGGVVLNEYWVMTAAHCVFARYNPAIFSLNFGYTDRLTPNPWSVTKAVSKIILHEGYNSRIFLNDIAIMKLTTALTFSKYIVPACIPTLADVDYAGRDSWITGWGTTSFGGSLSKVLLEVDVPVLSDSRCYIKYKADKTSSFCAGETGASKDTCQGDSGGPLVVNDYNGENRGNWTVAGLTSYGRDCGDGGVYTRVSTYYKWIVDKLSKN